MTLATLLLAANPAPADAQLELAPAGQSDLKLALCFRGDGQQVRYQLKVRSQGTAGISQSGQSGSLVTSPSIQCPVSNRLGLNADSQIEAELHWWIDDIEQPTIRKSWPETRDANGPSDRPPVDESDLQLS